MSFTFRGSSAQASELRRRGVERGQVTAPTDQAKTLNLSNVQ